MTGFFDHLDLAALCDATVVREVVERNAKAANIPGIVSRVTELARIVSGLNATGVSGDTRAIVVYAPGRIEVLGKHTDYAGGSSLTCAVNHSFVFVAAISDEPGVRLQDAVLSSSNFLPYDRIEEAVTSSWLSYPATVIERFVLNFGRPGSGVALAFSNTIPRASGMSSSSALVVGLYLCLAALAEPEGTESFRENILGGAELADYLGCVENGYSYKKLAGRAGVGTQGGAQDHTAVLFSETRHLGHYGYRPLRRLNTVALPEGAVFIIGSSGVRARKSRGALEPYNNAVALARNGLESWNRVNGTNFESLGQLTASDTFSMTALEETVAEMDMKMARAVLNRVQQFKEETGSILPSAVQALKSGDMERFGLVVDRSQELTDGLLGNQVAETRFLASSARELGAWGASGFGAGFGGSVWAMVDQGEAEGIMRQWMAEYGRSFPDRIRHARFFVDPTGPGAFVIGADAEKLLLEPKF